VLLSVGMENNNVVTAVDSYYEKNYFCRLLIIEMKTGIKKEDFLLGLKRVLDCILTVSFEAFLELVKVV